MEFKRQITVKHTLEKICKASIPLEDYIHTYLYIFMNIDSCFISRCFCVKTTPCLIPLLLVQQAQGKGFRRLGQDLATTSDVRMFDGKNRATKREEAEDVFLNSKKKDKNKSSFTHCQIIFLKSYLLCQGPNVGLRFGKLK